MTSIVFHNPDGASTTLDVADGTTVMRAALGGSVTGIIGECGGQAMCATCHVLVRGDHVDRLPPVGEDEDEMLDCTAELRDPHRSRLGCQIVLSTELDGIEVDLPARQI